MNKDNIIKYKIVESKLKPNEIYWMFSMLLTTLLIILYYVDNKNKFVLFGALFLFIIGWLSNHSKRMENYLNYEKIQLKGGKNGRRKRKHR